MLWSFFKYYKNILKADVQSEKQLLEVVKQYQKGFSKEAAGLQNAQYVVLDFAKASSCQTGVNNLERAGQPLDRSTVFRNSIKRHEQVSSLIGLKPGYDQARPSALYFEQIVAKKTSQDRFNSLDNGCYQLGYASGGLCVRWVMRQVGYASGGSC